MFEADHPQSPQPEHERKREPQSEPHSASRQDDEVGKTRPEENPARDTPPLVVMNPALAAIPSTVDVAHAEQWQHTRGGLSLVFIGMIGVLVVLIGMAVTIVLGEAGTFAALERTEAARAAEFQLSAPTLTDAGIVASIIAGIFLIVSLIGIVRCLSVPRGTGLKSLVIGALIAVVGAIGATVAAVAWGDAVLAGIYSMSSGLLLLFAWLLFLFFLRGANRLLAQRAMVVSTGVLMIGYVLVIYALMGVVFAVAAGAVTVEMVEQLGAAVSVAIGAVALALVLLYLVILQRTRQAIDRAVPTEQQQRVVTPG